MQAKTVGRFTLSETASGEIAIDGPGDYMTEQGNRLIDTIGSGADTVFNMTAHLSPDILTAVGVRLQTDFAGWKGTRDFCAAHGIR